LLGNDAFLEIHQTPCHFGLPCNIPSRDSAPDTPLPCVTHPLISQRSLLVLYEAVSHALFPVHLAQRGAYLDEANVRGLLAETLTADIKAVFPDQTSAMCADPAKRRRRRGQSCPRSRSKSASVQRRGSGRAHHWREPLPYFRGREFQTLS
jgi:hypothetical protein